MTNDVDPSEDTIPPGQVTDLRVTNLPHVVTVEFTAPGDDLDSDDAAAKYIVKFSSTVGNLTGANFDSEIFNTRITSNDLIDSDLTPVKGGNTKTLNVKSLMFNKSEKYVIAMKAVDEAGKHSAVSNPVQVFRPPYLVLDTTTEQVSNAT